MYHFQNFWNFDLKCKHGKHKTSLRAWKVTETFKKRAPGLERWLEELEAIQSFLSLNGVQKTIQLAMESTE